MSTLNKCYLLILMGMSAACTSKQAADNTSGETIKFSLESSDEFLDDLSISFYQPEETDSSLIGSISMICQDGEVIYIGDDQEGQLLRFDKSGKFLGKVGGLGQGAGEFVSLSYFFINKESGLIGVLDENQQKVLYYGLNDNEFKSSVSFPDIQSSCCVPYEGGLLWYNQNHESGITDKYFVSTNADGNVSGSFVDRKFTSGYFTGSSNPLFSASDGIFGFTPYDMKLYEFDNGNAVVKYNLEIDGFQTPSVDYLNAISNGGQESVYSTLKRSEYISYYSVEMCPSLMVVDVRRTGQPYIGLLDRSTGRTVFMTRSDFAEKTGVGAIAYSIQNTIDDTILFVLEKDSLEEYLEADENDVTPQLKALLDSDNNNPIIMKLKL